MKKGSLYFALALFLFLGCKKHHDEPSSSGGTQTPPSPTLTLTRAGTGTGRIQSSQSGLDCGSTCSNTFAAGTVVTLTALPDTGMVFSGWSGGGCSGTGTCVVTLDADKTVTASFSNPAVTLKSLLVEKTGLGGGTITSSPAGISCGVDCSENFSVGQSVTLTATPNGSSQFDGWTGGGCVGTGPCVVTVNGDAVVTANFSVTPPSMFALSVALSGTGSGTVASSPTGINCGLDCSETYTDGTPVTLTPTPDAISTFAGWSGACTGTGSCSVTMTQARSVTATFTKITYALTVTKLGTGVGAVSSVPTGINCGADCSETYTTGTSVQLSAVSDASSVFAGWSGDCSGTGICVVAMDSPHAVSATFTRMIRLTVSKIGSGSGTVTSVPTGIDCGVNCSQSYFPGTPVVLSAAPSGDLVSFNGWTGSCSGGGNCSLTLDSDASVGAIFKKFINDPTIIGFSSSYSTKRHFVYEPDMRVDTEEYSRDFKNIGTKDARKVKVTLTYSSESGGSGTVYGSSSQSFDLVLANETKTFSVFTDLNPNTSSWYYTRVVEAWVPDTSLGVAGVSPLTFKSSVETYRVINPLEGGEGKEFVSRILQE